MTAPTALLPRNRATDAFERAVARVLAPVVAAEAPLVVACSGGPDSVATFVAVSRALPTHLVTAAHFNHGLRTPSEAAGDAAFVEALGRNLGVPVFLGAPESALAGDEATARDARYRWLAAAAREAGATMVVTGHTRDDQAETVLLNLTRGSGLRGASGMALVSLWPVLIAGDRELRVVRPLLGVARRDVERYLAVLGIEARLDPTNELPTYARNRVRREVMPALETVNAEARAQIAAFADRAREADEALDRWATEAFEVHGRAESGCASIARRPLLELPSAVAKRVVAILGSHLGIALNAAQRASLVGIAGRSGARIDLAGAEAWTDREWLVITSPGVGRR